MDEFGSITIDNPNLLQDLLGLSGGAADPSQSNQKHYDETDNFSQSQLKYNNFSQFGARQKVYLESPTFTKGEDDIYRCAYDLETNI